MKTVVVFWLALLLLIGVEDVKAAEVYLLAGQSNMQGIGQISDLPPEVSEAVTSAYFWNGVQFEPFVLGETKTSTRDGEFGPEVGFAATLASEDRPICLIKYHASGMPLHHGWNGGQWEGSEHSPGKRNFYPGEAPDDPNRGVLYEAMMKEFIEGIAHLQEQGRAPVVKGMLWMQGEQDSKQQLSAESYAENLERLRRRVIEDLTLADDLPFVFGQVLPFEPPLPRFSARDTIRDRMAAADSRSGRPESIEHVRMVSTDGFTLLPDHVHYDAAGQYRLGVEFAKAIRDMTQAPAGDSEAATSGQ